jgi:tRNA dimethylallyltransferase
LRDRFDPTLPAFSAIGYHEAWAVADGTSTLEAAIELDAARNRTFAKRQRTWFRKEPDIVWIDATHEDPLDDALEAAREVAG